MLTESQRKNLIPLILHPRFGKMLQNSVIQWEKEDVNPQTGTYGLTIVQTDNGEIYDFEHKNKSCCLIGASLVGKTPNSIGDFETSLYDNYFISRSEYYNLYLGFDSDPNEPEKDSESFRFGRRVRIALGDVNKFDIIEINIKNDD